MTAPTKSLLFAWALALLLLLLTRCASCPCKDLPKDTQMLQRQLNECESDLQQCIDYGEQCESQR